MVVVPPSESAALHRSPGLDLCRPLRRQPGCHKSHQSEDGGTGRQDSGIGWRDSERQCFQPASKDECPCEPGRNADG